MSSNKKPKKQQRSNISSPPDSPSSPILCTSPTVSNGILYLRCEEALKNEGYGYAMVSAITLQAAGFRFGETVLLQCRRKSDSHVNETNHHKKNSINNDVVSNQPNDITHSERTVLVVLRPSTNSRTPRDIIQLDVLTRHGLSINVGDDIVLKRFTSLGCSVARHVVLRLEEPPKEIAIDALLENHVLNYIADASNGGILISNMSLALYYLGHLLRLRVDSIELMNIDRKKKKNPNDEDIIMKLNGLQLDCSEQYKITAVMVSSSKTSLKLHVESELIDAVLPSAKPLNDRPVSTVHFSDVGGLHRQIGILREAVELPLRSPEIFTRFDILPPRGVLLYGPPGTGKTLLARATAGDCGAHVLCINGPEILSKYLGETESRLRAVFAEASGLQPSCLIFIDEIDALCPKRDDTPSEVEKRIVATLLTLMDGLNSGNDRASSCGTSRVLVLGATNRPDSLDPALRRPGRFDREVEVGIPTRDERADILKVLLRHIPHSLAPEDISALSDCTHGFVGADLAAVCREAGLRALRQATMTSSCEDLSSLHVSKLDFDAAVGDVTPSAMREVMVEVPHVLWSEVGGHAEIKARLQEAVEWPLRHPEAFSRLGIRPPKGILLFGPPGCSKTLMAKALATESGLNFLAVKGPELFSMWVGESERALRNVFRKARAAAPSIIFFDEIDSIATRRSGGDMGSSGVTDRVLSQLLHEMDGVESLTGVTIVAATNRPDVLDPALLRPGRFDRILYVGPPNLFARKEIFFIRLATLPHSSDITASWLASITEGRSGAEVVSICREAALLAMAEDPENVQEVTRHHFEAAVMKVPPRITPESIAFYQKYQETCQLSRV